MESGPLFTTKVDRLFDALKALLERRTLSTDRSERIAALLLKLNLTHFKLVLDKKRHYMRTRPDSPYWDTRLEDFKVMLDDAVEAVELRRAEDSAPGFSMEVGVTAPMLYLIKRCRDPIVRRRAVTLLKVADCQEGIWNSNLIAQVGDLFIAVEEKGVADVRTCQDVPMSSRIGLTETMILPNEMKSANLRHQVGGTWFQHSISWD